MKLVDSSSEPTPVDTTADVTVPDESARRTRPRSAGRCDARAVKALVTSDALRDELDALFGEDPDLAT